MENNVTKHYVTLEERDGGKLVKFITVNTKEDLLIKVTPELKTLNFFSGSGLISNFSERSFRE